jgi:hypothetical protein
MTVQVNNSTAQPSGICAVCIPRRSFSGAAPAALFLIMPTTIVSNTQDSLPNFENLITIHAVATPTRKRRGEAAEAAFLARATHLGFTVLIPWGDSNRYDSVVELDRGFLRVQVKSATRYAETRYRV